jgi:two-component system response regulator AtoC
MKVLVIDDEAGVRRTVSLILEDAGYDVSAASDGREGLSKALEEGSDLILCDVRMPHVDGLEFVERYRAEGGAGLVIVMTAYGSIELAIDAMKRGAYDYLPKPFDGDQVLLTIRKAEEREKLWREVARLRHQVAAEKKYPDIVGTSSAMVAAIELVDRVAPHPSTVLVTGESGTGKELFARLIHSSSPRSRAPFIPVNCGAIPENLLESELFGHKKGSFTSADSDRVGLFEEASGGTLLLDEIGELPQQLQVKLLRALQEGEIRRVGESTSREVDVRVVAATAKDLESEVKDKTFRSDLFYRINVLNIHLPPLRHRTEDIPALVRHFVSHYNDVLGLQITGFASNAMKAMLAYPWPGNVRELQNVVERALVLADGPEIEAEQLPPNVRDPQGEAIPLVESLPADELSIKKHSAQMERRLIRRALDLTDGNRTRAAEHLQLSYRALLYKIRDYGLE